LFGSGFYFTEDYKTAETYSAKDAQPNYVKSIELLDGKEWSFEVGEELKGLFSELYAEGLVEAGLRFDATMSDIAQLAIKDKKLSEYLTELFSLKKYYEYRGVSYECA